METQEKTQGIIQIYTDQEADLLIAIEGFLSD